VTADPIRFLSIEDVFRLHALAIEDQGGDPSLRDRGLLESALAMPRQQFGGQYVHEDIPAMAAAYAFHICKNHPFVDGNKRAGTAAMIAFLSDNGWAFDADLDEAEREVLSLAAGEVDKARWTEWVRTQSREKTRIDLRTFFAAISVDEFFAAFNRLNPDALGNDPDQVIATLDEARRVAPFTEVLATQTVEATKSGNEVERLTALAAIKTVAALFRIAEDMGYEW